MLYVPRVVAIGVRYFTDPACSWSWGLEPTVRKLKHEFGADLAWTYVMGGLARDFSSAQTDTEIGIGGATAVYPGIVAGWLNSAEKGRMPLDPRLWLEEPIGSTYPACMAVKAAAEQAPDRGYGYLRALREGLLCFRRKLDTPDALVEEARGAGLDVARFRIDLASHATVEAFSADLDEARAVANEAHSQGGSESSNGSGGIPLPTMIFEASDGTRHSVYGFRPYDDYRAAAESAGARPRGEPKPGVVDALRRFGRMATREVEAVCELRGPNAEAELWRLATEWAVRPVRVLTGHLWDLADA